MPANVKIADDDSKENPMLGLIGFIIMIVVGGFAFAVSGPVVRYLTTANVKIGMSGIALLPLKFPEDWSPLANQLAVAFGIFLVIFVIAMVILFMFMKPASQDERSVSLDVMRKEVEARKKIR